ncbi:glycosyltransferase family 4 protein [Pseudomonas saliphila]|uniref:glycosyltransferase family 4 protein n=1 Tax=Pseudomonas saliphila TaxID=2586906 RepID=UPI00123B0B81|nr:glycosyltransferase family 4 protein [Pseudomonas saliphila]
MKFYIVGRYPPPIGGVSVYTNRRFNEMLSAGGDVGKIDLGRRTSLFKLLRKGSATYEVNSLNIIVILAFFITGKIGKAVFVDHNSSRSIKGVKKRATLWLIRHARKILIVNEQLRDFYNESITVELISPFIPPDQSEEQDVVGSYPVGLVDFLQQGKVLVNSSWKYVPYGRSDLYGVEDSVRLLNNSNYRLVLFIGDYDVSRVPQRVVSEIERFVQEGRLFLVTGQKQMWPVLKMGTCLFLRLTPTDGDSVSVREALYFGCPVIASNAAARPEGCMLYDYNCPVSLIEAISEHYSD